MTPPSGKRAVWKFVLGPGVTNVPMSAGARLLHVHEQDGRAYLWAEVDPDAPTVDRWVRVVGTGMEFPPGGTYIGTFHLSGLVFHAYDHGAQPMSSGSTSS
jgi:hypothetical protein